jgi:hypothetical protein
LQQHGRCYRYGHLGCTFIASTTTTTTPATKYYITSYTATTTAIATFHKRDDIHNTNDDNIDVSLDHVIAAVITNLGRSTTTKSTSSS